MKLLPKRVVNAELALQKKRDIDSGLELARKIDALRETLATEEKNLEQFRTHTIGSVQVEVDAKVHERDALEAENARRRDEIRNLAPLNLKKEWARVGDDKREIEGWKQHLAEKEVELISDFRADSKYSKRIYFSFKPIWWMMHYWDAFVADLFIPELSFGFDSLITYPAAGANSPVQGQVGRDFIPEEIWATIRAGAGTSVSMTDNGTIPLATGGDTSLKWTKLERFILCYDTSSIPINATISAATLSLNGNAKEDSLVTAPDINIYAATPGSPSILTAADYLQIGSTALCDTAITYAGWNSSDSYNNFALNATGIANIVKTGISRFGVRNANFDVANTAPAWVASQTSYVGFWSSNSAGTTNDPKLDITYTLPVIGKAYFKYQANKRASVY